VLSSVAIYCCTSFVYFFHVCSCSELVSTEGYSEWVQLVADFTIKSLQSWQVSPCSPGR